MIVRLLILLLILPLTARACEVTRAASVPVGVAGGSLTVPVQVNGITGTFLLDTGAERSIVTHDGARRLHLARDQWVATTTRGISGIQRYPNADPASLSLGGIPLRRRTLTGDTSLVVADMPVAVDVDGLLGRDFLSVFDLDLDLPNRRLTLYRVSGCTGHFLPWTGSYVGLPFLLPVDAPVIAVTIDRVQLRAILDTGASSSLIATPGMYRLGLRADDLAGDPTQTITGIGPRQVVAHRHRFPAMRVADESVGSPTLWVEPTHLIPIADMLLGADWLRTRRVWISFATRQVFFAGPQ